MRNRKLHLCLDIFWTFLKIGPSTFGGGYAMIPVIEREVVEKRAWIAEDEVSDIVAIAGSAPGGIGVNASAFIGFRMAGIPGALAAVIGIALPTFIIALVLSVALLFLQSDPKVVAAFKGIHGAIIGLIVLAAYNMARSAIFDKTTLITAVGTVAILLLLPINPLFMIIIGLFIGFVFVKVKETFGFKISLEKGKDPVHTSYNGYTYYDYFIADGI
ncbi:chromate transporter [Paenibacillus pectinilyticus]|uniref:Chromate transporter n=1 Tax=Paenibacillus pectinilyticus TaxID=512399 RepID=A0A1C0ZVM8_9BACL|nr:chromate transporter [Paenibacillus pectinilyticus]OCT12098.1 chromate transporter [Paenibacillus pectinilyticus]